ncbi:MAG: hypothetical protein ACOWWH_12525 [Eubacteriaceae bacterium]
MKYIITKPFKNVSFMQNCYNDEINIESENLIYSEIFDTHSCIQCNNRNNEKQIHYKCKQIANLVREIEELNK